MSRRNVSATLPTFPWDTIAEARRKAQSHPGGIVDLSVGTPVDPTPDVATEALTAAGDAHGYPQVWGCLLYTSPSPRDRQKSRMPSSA